MAIMPLIRLNDVIVFGIELIRRLIIVLRFEASNLCYATYGLIADFY